MLIAGMVCTAHVIVTTDMAAVTIIMPPGTSEICPP